MEGEAGDTDGAAIAYAELLPDTLRVMGRDHPDTLAVRCDFAYWRGGGGRRREYDRLRRAAA